MTYPNDEYPVPEMTVEAAAHFAGKVHKFVEHDAEMTGLPGDEAIEFAYDRFERLYGVGRWTVDHLRKGKAKTCDVSIFAKLRAAYYDLCARQVAKLQHEIAVGKATADDPMDDLEAEAANLAQKIAARKAAAKGEAA